MPKFPLGLECDLVEVNDNDFFLLLDRTADGYFTWNSLTGGRGGWPSSMARWGYKLFEQQEKYLKCLIPEIPDQALRLLFEEFGIQIQALKEHEWTLIAIIAASVHSEAPQTWDDIRKVNQKINRYWRK